MSELDVNIETHINTLREWWNCRKINAPMLGLDNNETPFRSEVFNRYISALKNRDPYEQILAYDILLDVLYHDARFLSELPVFGRPNQVVSELSRLQDLIAKQEFEIRDAFENTLPLPRKPQLPPQVPAPLR